jgi:hypothetical protein
MQAKLTMRRVCMLAVKAVEQTMVEFARDAA